MTKAVFALANSKQQAEKIIVRLKDEGFDSEYISFLVYDKDNRLTRKNAKGVLEANPDYFQTEKFRDTKSGTISHEKHTKAPEVGASAAAAGGIIGGSLGLLAGIGALAIPGFGPFVAAGPIMAALGGSAIGGGVGLLVGTLVGLGLPEYEAKKFEKGLREGNLLISVQTPDYDDIQRAQEILKEEGAKDISTVSEKTRSSY